MNNDLSQIQFSDFSQKCTNDFLIIALRLQQRMPHGISLYSELKLKYILKVKFSASYCLPFQHSRGNIESGRGFGLHPSQAV